MADHDSEEFKELLDKTLTAYEESTGEGPNDYQYAEIKLNVEDYLDGQSD